MKGPVYIYAIIFFTLPWVKAWGYADDDCIGCHRQGSDESKNYIGLKDYQSSIHGKEISCMDCHEDIKDITHTSQKPGRVDCLRCHKKPNLHAKDGSVSCTSCHPPHRIYPASDSRSSVNWKNLGDTCGKCHGVQGKRKGILQLLTSFQIASHPKQDFAKVVDKDMCVACHQGQAAHGESGPINDQQCPTCHGPLGRNSSKLGYIHMGADWDKQPQSFVAVYINLIGSLALAVLFFMAIRKNRK